MTARHADSICSFREANDTVIVLSCRLWLLSLRLRRVFGVGTRLPGGVSLGTIVFESVGVFGAQAGVCWGTDLWVLGEHVAFYFPGLEPEPVFEREIEGSSLEPDPVVVFFVVFLRLFLGHDFLRPAFEHHAPAVVLLAVAIGRHRFAVLLVLLVVLEDFLFEGSSEEVCAEADLGEKSGPGRSGLGRVCLG